MSDESGITFMCFSDAETGERWCEVDVSPPGEHAHVWTRWRNHADAYKAQHGEYPDPLDDDGIDLFAQWRDEYRAWYAEEQRARTQRGTLRLVT